MLEDINGGANHLFLTLFPFLVKEIDLSKLDKLPNRILSSNHFNSAPTILDNYREAIV